MRMAKASDRDLDMALNLISILDDIERHTFPWRFEHPSTEHTTWLDPSDRFQMADLLDKLQHHLMQGNIGRVILGMAVLCDPKNRLLDPDADHLKPHPRFDLLEELTNPPRQPDDPTDRYCYSIDEETYCGRYINALSAACSAEDDLDNDDRDEGERARYWIAECCHPLDTIAGPKRAEWTGRAILEQIEEWCHDEIGAEDQILALSREDEAQLGQLILNFIRSRAAVQYYGIKNEVEHTYIVGSNDFNADIRTHVANQLNAWLAERRIHAAA